MYSKEDGTPAEKLPNQVHGNTKKARYHQIMKEQQEISKELQSRKIGKTYEVLIEDMSFDGKYYIGRTMQDVPEMDGIVYIKNGTNVMLNVIQIFEFLICSSFIAGIKCAKTLL